MSAPHVPSPPAPGSHGPTLQGYGRFLRRNRELVALLTAIGALAGAGLVFQSPPEYVARETVAVTPQPTGADIDADRPSLVSLDSDAQILSSGDVLARAAIASGFPGGADALSASLDVSARPNSRVLIVRVTSDDHDLAIAACTAVVNEFLTTRAMTETERAAASAADLNVEIASLLGQLSEIDTTTDDGSEAAGTTAAQLAKDQLLTRLADLEDQLRVVTTAGTASPGTVTKVADAPVGGTRPMGAATLASGVLLGAITGVGVASAREAGIGRSARLDRFRARRSRPGRFTQRQRPSTVDA